MTSAFPSPCCKAFSRFLRHQSGLMQFACVACRSVWIHGQPAGAAAAKKKERPRRRSAGAKPVRSI